MFKLFRQWQRQRIIKRSTVSRGSWDKALRQLPLLDYLSDDDRDRLRHLAILFLHEKSFFGAHELEVNEEMRLVIALQACLPILNLDLDWYSGWTTIVVYPAGFAPKREMVDEYGLVHTVEHEVIGEAWQRGPVILSWEDTETAGILDGHNVVIHEFVHKLDMLNGAADGFPPQHEHAHVRSWSDIFTAAFADFQKHPKPGLNRYGATAPAEFLAVLSEVFFENPGLVNDTYPEVYATLSVFFKQDPIKMHTRNRTT